MTNVINAPWTTPEAVPRRTYREVYRRHRVLTLLPLVLAVLISGYFIVKPPPYTSVASLWVDSPVPATSTVLTPSPSGWVSTNMSNILAENLTSDSFLSRVAREAGIRPAPGPTTLQALGKLIVSAAPGPQLVTITVSNRSEPVAIALANATADQFTRFVATTLTGRDQSSLSFNRAALDSASAAVSAASDALSSYNHGHSGAAGNPADPTEVQLSRNLSAAQTQYSAAQQSYAQAEQAAHQSIVNAIRNSDVSGVPRILDRATSASRASRKKTLIYGGLGGLLGGITVSSLVLAALMSGDRSIRTEEDVEGLLPLEVAGAVEDIPEVRAGSRGRRRR